MTEPLEPAMHNDESLFPSRLPTEGDRADPGIRLSAPHPAKSSAMPGGVPPMFASHAQPREPHGDAVRS